jgi:hypothetical protein
MWEHLAVQGRVKTISLHGCGTYGGITLWGPSEEEECITIITLPSASILLVTVPQNLSTAFRLPSIIHDFGGVLPYNGD